MKWRFSSFRPYETGVFANTGQNRKLFDT
jgi:hypothetical protein